MSRPVAGPVARSTRMTSAPMSASIMAPIGPGPMPASSTILNPLSGPIASPPVWLRSSPARAGGSGHRLRVDRAPAARRLVDRERHLEHAPRGVDVLRRLAPLQQAVDEISRRAVEAEAPVHRHLVAGRLR